MRIATTLLTLSLLTAALYAPQRAAAQEAGVAQAVTFSRCVTEQQTHLARLVQMIEEAEARTGSSDAAVARDARESIATLVHRVHDVRDRLSQCIQSANIPAQPGAQVVRTTETPTGQEASVAGSGGTVSVIHPAESISEHVSVVRGERVDGRGTVPTEDLRRSVRAFVGSGVERCYNAYLDRVGVTTGEIEFTFAAVDGQIREVRVERAGFDAAMRTCVTRAVQGMSLAHTSGRSVFSYVLQVGG